MKPGMLKYTCLSYSLLLSEGIPASTLYHTFGIMMKNVRNRAPTTWRILMLFLSTCRIDPLAPENDFLTPPKSSLSIITMRTHPAARANAGAALNMNLPAESAMNTAALSHTTINIDPAVVCLGTLVIA